MINDRLYGEVDLQLFVALGEKKKQTQKRKMFCFCPVTNVENQSSVPDVFSNECGSRPLLYGGGFRLSSSLGFEVSLAC